MTGEARTLYEELYCARGDMENRIKEQFSLFADRVSTETIRANQMRLYLSAMAYTLVSGLRRLGLKATALAQAEVATIRTKLLKIGAQIRVTVGRSGSPWPPTIRGRAFISRSGPTCAAEGPGTDLTSSDLSQPHRPGSDRCARTCP